MYILENGNFDIVFATLIKVPTMNFNILPSIKPAGLYIIAINILIYPIRIITPASGTAATFVSTKYGVIVLNFKTLIGRTII